MTSTAAAINSRARKGQDSRYAAARRAASGFTLVELLAVTVIIGLLASIAIANFIGAQTRAARASVTDNMHALQVASEAYATDSGGIYAINTASITPYLPGGGNSLAGSNGYYPDNPLSGVQNETPFTCSYSTTAQIMSARSNPPTQSGGTIGQIGYNQCDSGSTYAVIGTDERGYCIGTVSNALVLSNQ